jgi:magnesium-transporting ATPase (P-type)
MLEGFDIIESVGIAVTILISTLVSTVSELGSEKAFNKLDREFENIKVKVYRDGRLKVLKSTDIVVNDVVLVNSGDKIAADGLIIQGEITVDQPALTGETKEINKKVGDTENFSSDNPSALFCGSLATSGECLMRVTAVGDNTYYGKTAKDLTSESPSSPLKEKLTKLYRKLIYKTTYSEIIIIEDILLLFKHLTYLKSNLCFLVAAVKLIKCTGNRSNTNQSIEEGFAVYGIYD